MQQHWNPSMRPPFGHEPRYSMHPVQRFGSNMSQYRPHMPPPPRCVNQERYMRHPNFGPPRGNFVGTVHNHNYRPNFENPTHHGHPPAEYISNNHQRGGGRGNMGRGMKRNLPQKHSQQPTNKKKKMKEKKERDADTCPFYCKPCDRGYMTEDTYNEHCNGHIKCHGEGCSYVAADKLVKLHYEMQHRTGLAKKIWKLESKEEIEKWRQERKRNFPTKANIERKQQELNERKARGEVVETKQFGKMKGSRNKGGGSEDKPGNDETEEGQRPRRPGRRKRGQWKQRQNKGENGITAQANSAASCSTESTETADKTYDPALDPLAYVIAHDKEAAESQNQVGKVSVAKTVSQVVLDHSTEKQEPTTERQDPLTAVVIDPAPQPSHKLPPPITNGALGALASLYGDSDSEDDQNCGEEAAISTQSQPDAEQHVKSSTGEVSDNTQTAEQGVKDEPVMAQLVGEGHTPGCDVQRDGVKPAVSPTAVPEEGSQESEKVSRQGQSGQKGGQQRRGGGQRGRGGKHKPAVPLRRLTLLQRLLAPEIRHERNVVMQCIRHIVNSDFFGVPLADKPSKQSVSDQNDEVGVLEDRVTLGYGQDEIWETEEPMSNTVTG